MSANENRPVAIQVSGVKKMYRLGQIGGGTLQADLQSWWARVRGKEDPNTKIGEGERIKGQTFMALNGIDLTIYQGEAVGIIGSNGAGKSTLLKLLSKVTAPTEGEIDIYGRIASMLEVGTGFNGELTGRENVYMNGAILGMTKQEIDAKMEQIIEFSEVRDFIDTPVKRYSSGMFVKLAFSVAAHLDSEIMIMDEVLAVGDMAFQTKCLNKMKEAASVDGRTVLYVSHNMSTIRNLCDRCIVLDKGKVIFEGNVDDAIGIYSNVEKNLAVTHYDFSNANRAYEEYARRVKITELEFVNKDKAVFDRVEPVVFSLSLEAYDNVDDIKLYFILFSINGERIGVTQTYNSFLSAKKDHQYSFLFSFDISNIAAGKYYFQPDIFWGDVEGRHHSLDHPVSGVSFEIIDTHKQGINWQPYFSHIRLNELKVIKNE